MADVNGGSPWDEPVPEEKAAVKSAPTVVGDLDVKPKTAGGQAQTNQNQQPQQTELKVPTDTSEKVGATVPAAEVAPDVAPAQVPVSAPPQAPTVASDHHEKNDNFWQSVYGQGGSPGGLAEDVKQSVPTQPQLTTQAPIKPQQSQHLPIQQPKKIKVEQVVSTTPPAPTPQGKSQIPLKGAATNQSQMMSKAKAPKRGLTVIISAIVGLFILFAGGVYLTEIGLISIGLEKVYGFAHLESIWGGLPANAENAFVMSAAKMKSQTGYKISGTATLTINKGVKSEVISPIVAQTLLSTIALRDENLGIKIPANMASTDSASSEPTVGSTDSSSNSASAGNTSSTSSMSTVEQFQATINSAVSGNIIGADIGLRSASKPSSEITLISANENLYVKTSNDISYSSNTSAKSSWIKIPLKSSSANNTSEQFFAGGFGSSDFSIVGSRLGNDNVDGTRCYHYSGTVSVGSALEDFGIKNTDVSSLNLDFWLGVKDHLIYKVEMKLIPGSDSAVTRVDSSLTFSDYGIASDQFSVPTISTLYSTPTAVGNNDLDTASGRDKQRKADLASIATALESYHSATGRYPQVSGTAKISDQSGVLFNTLVPTYISSLPLDPQDPTYYYGYVSDGSSFKLSCVLEDKTDTAGQAVGSLWIYYLSSL